MLNPLVSFSSSHIYSQFTLLMTLLTLTTATFDIFNKPSINVIDQTNAINPTNNVLKRIKDQTQ